MKKTDYIVIAIISFIGIATLFAFNASHLKNTSESWIVVTVDGAVYDQFLLNQETKKELLIESSSGYNLLIVENGLVDMTDSDCKNNTCVNTRPASQIGELIVCLPHKVIVEIVAADQLK